MSQIVISADTATTVLNGRIITDIAAGDYFTLTPSNPLTSRANSANNGVTISGRVDAGVHVMVIRVQKFSNDDKLSVSINGLKPSTRLQLLKSEDEEKYIPVRLEVGYDGKLRQVFQGSVKSGAVKREGAIHIVSLECEDGGHDYINAFTSRTVRGKDQVVDSVLQDMPNTKKGSVTKQQALIRPKVLVGSSSKILTDTLAPDESFFIKDERVHILKANEVTSGNIPVVNARSGLLNTPQATKISAQDDGGKKGKTPTNDPDTDPAVKKDTDSSTLAKSSKGQIVFDTKLNPMLVIGGLCAIESVTNPALNGVYKIYQVETSGQNNGAAWYQKVVCQPAGNYAVIK